MASSSNGLSQGHAVNSIFDLDNTPGPADQVQSQGSSQSASAAGVHTQILSASSIAPAAASAAVAMSSSHEAAPTATIAAASMSNIAGWTPVGNETAAAAVGITPSLVSFEIAATTHAGATSQPVATSSALAPTLTGNSNGLQINLIWDSSVSSAPAGFQQAIIAAANMLDAAFSNKIVLNFDVGYNEIGGTAFSNPNESLGGAASGIWQSISTVKSELAGTTSGAAAAASIVTTLDPNSGVEPSGSSNQIAVWGGQQKAFGVVSGSSSQLDGEVGFGSGFTGNILLTAGLHELAHAMGRISGYSPYGILDLYRYSAPGVHQYAGPTAAYLSLDGGKTVLANYDTTSDYGDFASNALTTNDPFNAYVSPNSGTLTTVDLKAMGAIGYTLAGGSSGNGPDLVATGLAVNSASVAPGANINLSFHIANTGSASAGSSVAAIYIDGKSTVLTTNVIAALAAGGSAAVTDSISTAGLSVGSHTLTVVADATSLVTESDETNNSSAITFNVAATQLPDLLAQNLATNVNTVVAGKAINLSFAIADKGLTNVGQSVAEVFIDGSATPVAMNAINAMAANGSTSVTDSISTAGLAAGAHTLTVKADATNQITESNETNNSSSISFTVAPSGMADLVVNSITPSAAKVLHGQRFNFSYSVEDIGGAAARSSWAGVYLDGHSNAIATNGVAALGTGAVAFENNSISTAGLGIGAHTLTIVADATNLVAESNKANNARTITFNVV